MNEGWSGDDYLILFGDSEELQKCRRKHEASGHDFLSLLKNSCLARGSERYGLQPIR